MARWPVSRISGRGRGHPNGRAASQAGLQGNEKHGAYMGPRVARQAPSKTTAFSMPAGVFRSHTTVTTAAARTAASTWIR